MEYRFLFVFQPAVLPWYLRWLRKNYQHVGVMIDCWPRNVYRYHSWNSASIDTRVGAGSKLSELLIELQPTEVVEYWGEVSNVQRFRFGPMSCVEFAKHVASLSAHFAITPWQLRRWLLNNGGTILEYPYHDRLY